MKSRYTFFAHLCGYFLILLVGLSSPPVQAQQALQNLPLDTLFAENFDDCIQPTGWSYLLSGDEDGALWGYGIPTNPASEGTSIDGTCMLYFDDDGAGNDAPAWRVRVNSPSFNASNYPLVFLEMDVNYRDGNNDPAGNSLAIYVKQGNVFQLVKKYKGEEMNTGANYDQNKHLRINISEFASADMAIRIEFGDGDMWGWWRPSTM